MEERKEDNIFDKELTLYYSRLFLDHNELANRVVHVSFPLVDSQCSFYPIFHGLIVSMKIKIKTNIN